MILADYDPVIALDEVIGLGCRFPKADSPADTFQPVRPNSRYCMLSAPDLMKASDRGSDRLAGSAFGPFAARQH